MFSRQNVTLNAKIICLGNYFGNLQTPVFIFNVFITEIYLTIIWRDNWRSVFDAIKDSTNVSFIASKTKQ